MERVTQPILAERLTEAHLNVKSALGMLESALAFSEHAHTDAAKVDVFRYEISGALKRLKHIVEQY